MSVRADVRPIIAFVATVFGLGAALSGVIALTGGRDSPLLPLSYVSMLLPAAAVYVVRLWSGERPVIDGNRLPVRYVPIALGLMPVVMHAAMLPAMYAVAGRLPWKDAVSWPRAVTGAIVGVVIVSGLALFEEIGWRGWLLPRVAARVGMRLGIVITSSVWSVWHIPFVTAGILFVEGVPRFQTAMIVPLGVAGSGLVLGWLWARTKSIWIVALAHGALNNWGQLAFKYMEAGPGVDLAPVLVSGGIALVVVGAVLIVTL